MGTVEILRGAFDLHVHGYPEGRADADHVADDIDAAVLGRDLGMRGCLLKSHFWPTMGRAYHTGRQVEGYEVLPSITLNVIVGGVSPAVVEMAALQGARAVWLPTWCAAHDIERGGLSARLGSMFPGLGGLVPAGGVRVLSEGVLSPAAADVLKLANELGLVVGTGHLSPAEAIALAREADRIGFRQLIFTHPWSKSVGATHEEVRAAAELGAWIEMPFVGMLPVRQYVGPDNVVEIVDLVGVDRCVLTTDGGFTSWSSPAPTMMSLFVASLLASGVDDKSVRAMIVDNPASLLGLPEAPTGGEQLDRTTRRVP